jgi:flagellar FliJ protein
MSNWARSLIRISNHEVETLQKRLAVLVEARMAAEMKLTLLHAEAEAESAHASVDAQAGWYRLGFLEGWRKRRDLAQQRIEEALVEEAGARDALSRAFEELKKFEQVAEMARLAEVKEEQRRETAALDEMGLRSAMAG